MAQSGESTFKLAMTLHGHSGDVKALSAPSQDVPLLLSASRDGSAILWGPGRDGLWEVKLRAQGPEGKYVNSVGMVRYDGQGKLNWKRECQADDSLHVDRKCQWSSQCILTTLFRCSNP